eukprot:258180-Amorphochlora_amoeboformis.AAC.2
MATVCLLAVLTAASAVREPAKQPVSTLSSNPPPGMPGITTNNGILKQFGPYAHNNPMIKNTPSGLAADLP